MITAQSTDRVSTCGNCLYWKPTQPGQGECRFGPPTVLAIPMEIPLRGIQVVPVFVSPQTTQDHACGQHSFGIHVEHPGGSLLTT